MFLLTEKRLDLFEFLMWDSRPGPKDSKTKLCSRSFADEAILILIETAALRVTTDWGCVR
jgi:hypothetical protein